ncbi:type II secretion system minor pseudopilin GspI [Pseudomonas sp. TMB3-21]
MVERVSLSRMGGFTLLEIMVALAIFSTLAAAVLSASQYVVKQTGRVEERLVAAWLADNQLNELRLQTGVAIGQSQSVVAMNHRDWLLQQRVSTTGHQRLFQVDIDVSLAGRQQSVHHATGWVLAPYE